jgi:hypothetical protein
MPVVSSETYYYVGEKPPPLPCRYQTDKGALINSIAGATLTAKCKTDGATEFDVACTNSGDGTFTINWGTSTSSFAVAGSMRIDIQVSDGTRVWYMPRFSLPVYNR